MSIATVTPSATNLTQAAISSLANTFAEEMAYRPGGDLRNVVEALGGQISYYETSSTDAASGSIFIEPESFEIRLPMDTGPLRDRFTIAHELGHLVLHYYYPQSLGKLGPHETMVATRFGQGRVESEANWFAASFLMPAADFTATLRDRNGSLSAVAQLFGVSVPAARVRAESLHLQFND
ncbi:ImmA/IrrE family metallo-endopeptidase [Eoetvoesiella caeni]